MTDKPERTDDLLSSSRIADDERGFITLEELIRRRGWQPQTRLYLETGERGWLLHRPVSELRRVYVEPTNACNLDCRTCVRRAWQETPGFMEPPVFEQVLTAVRSVDPRPSVFFGGFGEPLSHPDILEMVQAAHAAGAVTELISNGVQLDGAMAEGLIRAGLDFLWVSIDGARPESYLDVRLGDELPRIIENLQELRQLRYRVHARRPKLGIAFVAMKRNLKDLPEVVAIGRRLGARKFHVSNVLPYTPEMQSEILYRQAIGQGRQTIEQFFLPRVDADLELLSTWEKMFLRPDWMGLWDSEFKAPFDTCPFVTRGSVSIRWDGKVSPCLALLHTHQSFLDDVPRRIDAGYVGDLNTASLLDIWHSEHYVGLRERLQEFDFSPCTLCSSCELVEGNREDCFGSPAPACGGCLWAQGFIRCP